MKLKKRAVCLILASTLTFSLSACGKSTTSSVNTESSSASESGSYKQDNSNLNMDMAKWNYDATNDLYWQIGVSYCSNPAATKYESMGIYVPGQYMTGTKNSDGTYTCKVNESGTLNGYTSSSAPIILPVDTPGYIAQAAPTSYDYNSISSYVKAGYVYVVAGMRGRSSMQGTATSDESYSGGAPWGITDLKAAVRYYRFNASSLPGDTEKFFSYGMSGGGAQSALIGATGDSSLYYPYLESIGAAMTDASGKTISDAVAGSMCWCPITNLDYADEAYEWNMGQYFSTDTRATSTFTSALSKDMATAFAEYVNKLGLKSEDGTVLSLTKSDKGVYNAGTYYDYLLSEIETSLNNFLSDNTFPYTATQTQIQVGNTATSGSTGEAGSLSTESGMSFGGPGNGSTETMHSDGTEKGMPSGGMMGGGPGGNSSSSTSGTTYQTVQDYINSLNTDGTWVTYDASTNTAKITSIEDFVTHCKNATKSVGAFDSVDASQGENNLFANGQSKSAHFDAVESNLLSTNKSTYSTFSDWKDSYLTAFTTDLTSKDSVGSTMETRSNMYNPMYYLTSYYSGYKSSTVAKYWRIRTGINQTDTALTTEEDLKLALESYSGVKNVDFATVWGLPHTTAERTGDSTENFISWVSSCTK